MTYVQRRQQNKIMSQSIEFGNLLFCQGVTATTLSKNIAGQTSEVLQQIDEILASMGSDKSRLLQAQIWLKDIRHRDAMNEVWAAWLPVDKAPVRACVEANMADPQHLIEIMVIAHK